MKDSLLELLVLSGKKSNKISNSEISFKGFVRGEFLI